MAQAVEQFGKIKVKIAQKRIHAHHIGQRNAQIAAVFVHPCLQSGCLEIAQTHVQRLKGLQKFVRHRANRREIEFFRQIHIAGAAKHIGCRLGKCFHHMLLPCQRVTAARAEIGHQKRRVSGLLLPVIRLNQRYFFLQSAFAFHQYLRGLQAAEIQLVHNRQNVNFEEHRLYHRAFDADVQPARIIGTDADKAAFELEQFQIIDKIALDEAQTAQIR